MPNLYLEDLDQIEAIETGDILLITDISEDEDKRSKKVSIQQLDARFGKPIGATPSGQMVNLDGVTVDLPTQNQWVKVTGFTPSALKDVTFNDDTLVVGVSGLYLFNGSLSGQSIGPTEDFEVGLFVNGALVPQTAVLREYTNDPGVVATSDLLQFNANDILDVRVRCVTDNEDFVVNSLKINLHGI